MPSSASSRLSCCDTADCARCSSSPAFVKDPWRAIATTVLRCRSSIPESLSCAHPEVEDGSVGSAITSRYRWRGFETQSSAGLDLVTYRENSALRRRFEQTLGEHGLTPRNAFICTEMAGRSHPRLGMGVAVIPRSAAEEPGPPIELRPIGPEPFTWPVALVWRARRRQPPAAKAFLALAIARADEASPPVRLVA